MGHITKGERLCTSGPYSLCRHPLYLGNIIVLLGLLLVCRDVLLAATLITVAGALYPLVISAEEVALAQRFGDEWLAYQSRVPAIIPALRPPTGRMDWRLALENKALLNWALVALVVALLAAKPWLLGPPGEP
ncbi:MAG: isoprenylcysteine carboxylmethyltransferase family protein [Armatimonadetes bacterium]|nr:isoprenylcysteine carboxylmethyltransferase family protein [Armatimonadota bacterium]